MQRHPEQQFEILDGQQRQIGQFMIDRSKDDLLFGKFTPGPAFFTVEHLFRQFEEAVNAQALGVVDELDAAISALGLHFSSPDGLQDIGIHDVQIWSDGDITCKLSEKNVAEIHARRPSFRRGLKSSEEAERSITMEARRAT